MKTYSELFRKDVLGSPESPSATEDFNPDESDLTRQKQVRYKQDTVHRKSLIKWVMWIIPFWLIAVLLITVFAPVCRVSDTVKTTLLITTTANVIGLALVVLKGMFK